MHAIILKWGQNVKVLIQRRGHDIFFPLLFLLPHLHCNISSASFRFFPSPLLQTSFLFFSFSRQSCLQLTTTCICMSSYRYLRTYTVLVAHTQNSLKFQVLGQKHAYNSYFFDLYSSLVKAVPSFMAFFPFFFIPLLSLPSLRSWESEKIADLYYSRLNVKNEYCFFPPFTRRWILLLFHHNCLLLLLSPLVV